MISKRVQISVIAVLLLASPGLFAEEIVAILDLKFIEETDLTAAVMCFGEDESDCHEWAVYYLFEAKVDKVISGHLPDKRFRVLYGRHALAKRNIRNMVALLKERDISDSDEPRYRIAQSGEKRTMHCFDYRVDDDIEVGVLRNDQIELNCYDDELYR